LGSSAERPGGWHQTRRYIVLTVTQPAVHRRRYSKETHCQVGARGQIVALRQVDAHRWMGTRHEEWDSCKKCRLRKIRVT
jgi:hypothetical protein